jgi:hypothetical protein
LAALANSAAPAIATDLVTSRRVRELDHEHAGALGCAPVYS